VLVNHLLHDVNVMNVQVLVRITHKSHNWQRTSTIDAWCEIGMFHGRTKYMNGT